MYIITFILNAQSIRETVKLAYYNNNLSGITLSSGTLNPKFSIGTTIYTASVASSPIALSVGSNAINVEVTAQDGITIKTYSINVTRASVPPPTPVTTEPTIDTYIVQEDLLDKETMITEDGKAVELFTVKEGLKEQISKAKPQGANGSNGYQGSKD